MVEGTRTVKIIISLNIRHGFLLANEQLFFISGNIISIADQPDAAANIWKSLACYRIQAGEMS